MPFTLASTLSDIRSFVGRFIAGLAKNKEDRLALEIGGIILVLVILLMPRCRGDKPEPLPAKVTAAVEQHHVQTAVDSVTIKRLTADAEAQRRRAESATAREQSAYRAAEQVMNDVADSLAKVAAAAKSAHDSAVAFDSAYQVRTREADSLVVAKAQADSAKALEHARGDSLFKALTISETGRRSADSLATALVGVARKQSATSCRFALVIPCPTRTQAAVVSAITAAVATHVIEHGGIGFSVKIP